jgi:hypothetical protein
VESQGEHALPLQFLAWTNKHPVGCFRGKVSSLQVLTNKPILTVVSNIGEDVQYICFNKMYDVKSVSQPDTMPILENNYCLQIIETGFAEQF